MLEVQILDVDFIWLMATHGNKSQHHRFVNFSQVTMQRLSHCYKLGTPLNKDILDVDVFPDTVDGQNPAPPGMYKTL